jgi:SAM-dependent methyltransferase
MPPVKLLSTTREVSMANAWFEFATSTHFWMRRRFTVLRRMLSDTDLAPMRLAEIGCGSGCVLTQFRDQLNINVDGFDLNMNALEYAAQANPDLSLHCYDILEEHKNLVNSYDGLFILDVLEHIENDAAFMRSAHAHLKPGGFLVLNVPGSRKLFSRYDEVAGHVRRYEPENLAALAVEAGFNVERWSWWGRPLKPLITLRKYMVRNIHTDKVITRGFQPPGKFANRLLSSVAGCEHIPQHNSGCSIMMVLQKTKPDTSS